MDKDVFKEFYQFKPSDVIKGLNRYFAETKANRYRRVPLEIRKGACFDNPYNVLFCKPEEYVGVAINWLREEHDIFYTPGMEAPVEDFDVDAAAKEYEKATRNDLKEALQRRLYEANRRIIALEKGHIEKSKIIDRQEARIKELEEKLEDIKDICDGNFDVMNVIGK